MDGRLILGLPWCFGQLGTQRPLDLPIALGREIAPVKEDEVDIAQRRGLAEIMQAIPDEDDAD